MSKFLNQHLFRQSLSSPFNQYFDAQLAGKFLVDTRVVEKNAGTAIKYLVETINKLKLAGKVPILVSPPPRSGFNIGSCLERQERNLFYIRDGCNLDKKVYMAHEASIIDALTRVKDETGVRIVWISDLLCDDYWCQTKISGTYIYRDNGHLSIDGSKVLLGSWIVNTGGPLRIDK